MVFCSCVEKYLVDVPTFLFLLGATDDFVMYFPFSFFPFRVQLLPFDHAAEVLINQTSNFLHLALPYLEVR